VTASNVRVYSEPKRDGDPFAFKLLDNVAELHFDGDILIGPGLFQGHLGESYPFAFSAPETLPTVSAGTVTVSLNSSSPNTELQVLVDAFNIWIYARRGAASSCGVPPRTNWIYCSEDITNVFSPLNITSNLTLGAPMTIQAGITIGSQSEVISITFDPGAGTWMDISGCLAFNQEDQPVVFEVAFSPSSIPVIDGQSASYPISWNRSIITTAEQCPLNFTGLVSSGRVIPAATSIDGQVCDFNTTSVQTSFLGLELQCGFFPRAPADPPLSSGVTPSVGAPTGAPISQSIQSSPTGAIVGGVIGAMVAVAAAILIVILLMRRSKRSNIKRGSDRDDADSTPLAPIAGSGGEIPSDLVDAVPAFQKSGAVKFVQFSDMTFMQELGKGSFGSVTLALLNGEFVAVKTVNAARDGTIKLLEKEAASFSAIKPHRNIVKFIGVFSEGEKSGIVMEFCPKGSLAVHAKRMRHNLSPYDLFKFGFGILEGMVVLASSGVVHCDLAGRNVLLDERFFTKVSDFGSSQRGTTQEAENTEDTLGPYKWQSPEAVKSHKFSEKSDVWSFGATMVEILTKREPYHGFKGSTLQLVERIGSGATDPWRHLKESDPGLAASLPEWIEPVLVSCFTIDDSQRPTFREVRYQLSKLCPELKNMYEAEVDEADSVLNSDYQAVPSLSSGSAWTTSAPTEKLEAASSPAPELDSGGLKAIDVVRLNRLGEGSFGSVWLAKYQDQFVALKVLNVGNNKSEEIRREAGIMSTIAPHRNIIRLHGLITEESSELCIVMELAPKGSLEDYVKASRAAQQDIKEALLFKWCIGVARGMALLSASHVIHRDLSARNVLLDSSLEPKIADFGLGRQVLDPNQETSTQTDVGPLRWFAPECFELKYSEKTDVWAFGCTLVELLTGDVPFPRLSAIETAVAVRDEERNALECVDIASTPPWMIATMKACFARDPKLRASFADLVKQLEEAATMIQEINDAEELIRKRRARRGQTIVGDR
jgi:serine/threonine protein kinase